MSRPPAEPQRLREHKLKSWHAFSKRTGLFFSEPTKGSCCVKKKMCVGDGLVAITWRQKCQTSEVAMVSLTSTIRAQPLTFCNLSMFKQTLSGSWKYKCQVFPHENSSDLDPEGKQGPIVSFSLSVLSLSDLSSPLVHFMFPVTSSLSLSFTFPAFSRSLPASAMWHTGPVHLLVDSVVVISCGSCRGQRPAGVLWCNDPCHRLSPPSGQWQGEVDGR